MYIVLHLQQALLHQLQHIQHILNINMLIISTPIIMLCTPDEFSVCSVCFVCYTALATSITTTTITTTSPPAIVNVYQTHQLNTLIRQSLLLSL